MTEARKIELVPAPEKSTLGDWNLYPGRKAIMVDGELYGYAIMKRRGAHGTSYWFEQASGETVQEKTGTRSDGSDRFAVVEVWGDKVAGRRRDSDTRPVAVRLLEKATQLVESGKLISKKQQDDRVALAREIEAKAAETRERRIEEREWLVMQPADRRPAVERRLEEKELRDRAAASIIHLMPVHAGDFARAVDNIVGAMKWAAMKWPRTR